MYTINNIENAIYISFSNVPTEKVEQIQPMFHELLKTHISTKAIDIERFRLLIKREKLKRASDAETSPHYTYAMPALADHIYGKLDGSQLENSMPLPAHLEVLESYTAEDWAGLIQTYLVDAPFVCVRGVPSPRLAKELVETEKERIRVQRETLGEAKLKDLEAQLEQANANNNVDVPKAILETIQVPSIGSIALIPVESSRGDSGLVAERIQQDLKAHTVGLSLQFDHVASTFVELRLLVDTSHLSIEQRLWLNVYMDAFFETAGERDGKVIPYEEVVKQLDIDTVEHYSVSGVNNNFVHYACFSIKVETAKYDEGVRWLHDLLYHSHFTADRLQTAASKILQDLPSQKREGAQMASAALKVLAFQKDSSNHVVMSPIVQQPFLTSILKRYVPKKEIQKIF